MALGIMLGEGGEELVHGAANGGVGHRPVGHIDEGQVDAHPLGHRVVLMAQAEGLAYAPPHEHAVHGMAKPPFGHRDEEGHRCVGAPTAVGASHGAKWIGKARKFSTTGGEKLVDGAMGAEFLLLVEAETLHRLRFSPCCFR